MDGSSMRSSSVRRRRVGVWNRNVEFIEINVFDQRYANFGEVVYRQERRLTIINRLKVTKLDG